MEEEPTRHNIIVARQNTIVNENVLSAEIEVEGTPKSSALSRRYEQSRH